MSSQADPHEAENDFPEQQQISPASLMVEAVAAAVALAFTILLLKEVLPFLN